MVKRLSILLATLIVSVSAQASTFNFGVYADGTNNNGSTFSNSLGTDGLGEFGYDWYSVTNDGVTVTATGSYIDSSGNTQDANSLPISKHAADEAMDAATCIGCGACVATCKNSSAMLFVGAKVSQYALLPQGQVEAADRVQNMVAQMDLEGFGNCTNTGACEIECPKGISLDNIARMNRELMKANL